jgi:hypothetical protein
MRNFDGYEDAIDVIRVKNYEKTKGATTEE